MIQNYYNIKIATVIYIN